MSTRLVVQREIESRRALYVNALTSASDADRFVQMAVATICSDPKVMECTRESIFECLMQGASLRLMPGKMLGQLYFIPFKDRKTNTRICTIIIGYKGLTTLAYRSGDLDFVTADVVFEKDKFEYELGSEPTIKFQKSEERDRGKRRGAYIVWQFKSGNRLIEFEPMAKLYKHRDASADYRFKKDGSLWVSQEDEMLKKTMIRSTSKTLNLASDFHQAVAFEDDQESRLVHEAKPDMEREHVTDAEWKEAMPV